MSLVLTAVLIIGGIVLAAALVIAVPAVFGMMAYDAAKSRKDETVAVAATETDVASSIALKRLVARAFVLAGGTFWTVATFAGLYSFRDAGITSSAIAAFIPATASLVTLIIGWYYERFTAVLLFVASLAAISWGVIYQFEAGVWMIMTFALIGPMMTAAAMFWAARREQEAYEHELAISAELAPAFAENTQR